MKLSALAAFGLALLAPFSTACGQTQEPSKVEPSIEVERAFPNLKFKRPLFLTPAGDGSGRLFVIEKMGVIRVFEDKQDVGTSKVFLDINEQVSVKGNEEGLLGIAFHPQYAENGKFYVHYSSSVKTKVGILSEFQVSKDDPDKADPASARVLIEQKQPWRNHNGGMIEFGPDNMLYWALGDGGAGGDPKGSGQDLTSLLGTILRIDVDTRTGDLEYGIPKDNPFVNEPEGARGEIFAFGLRNVWRFSFDRKTGELWAADVGQGRWEEVDLITSGGNYGWKVREGFEVFTDKAEISFGKAIDPIAVYGRKEGISITGGYVYRGERFPSLQGSYIYGDYQSGNVWRITKDDAGQYHNAMALQDAGIRIASFGEDSKGELYVLGYDSGTIMRVVPKKP
ncbi:MAG: PQQ-dependent sugar dehydrogenase [Planctomycetota bacterium]|nr:PQQ-dependent sugar dehydrogenase [Planctomycetota bacterium]